MTWTRGTSSKSTHRTTVRAMQNDRLNGASASAVQQDYTVPIYRVELVAEREESMPILSSPDEVANFLIGFMARFDREHFVVVMLANNLRVIGVNVVHVGTVNASIVSPRDVFKPVLLANSAHVIVAHNHPSTNLEPSDADVQISKRLKEGGQLLEITVLDSLVIGRNGFTSLVQRGLLG